MERAVSLRKPDGTDVTVVVRPGPGVLPKSGSATTPSVTLTGTRGWNYSSKVEDKAALAKVKVGD
jgi:hypothetical protein